jgi:3-phytase
MGVKDIMRKALCRTAALLSLFWAVLSIGGCGLEESRYHLVAPAAETDPVYHSGDAADDMCVWVNPEDPSASLIIGTDKKGGLVVYELDGTIRQYIPCGEVNNVDIRAGYMLDGEAAAVIGASNQSDNSIVFFTVNEAERSLESVTDAVQYAGIEVYGFCMYRSPLDGEYYCFVNSRDGEVEQWRLETPSPGTIRLASPAARAFTVGSQTEGCVADDAQQGFYISEEEVGIWRYGAEPGDGSARVGVDTIALNPDLAMDLEGLALYTVGADGGYLVASSQGSSSFAVYTRTGNLYLGSFRIVDGLEVDGVSDTDGIEAVSADLGGAYSSGLFIAQDGTNSRPYAYQNFKLVPWGRIASVFEPPLSGAE